MTNYFINYYIKPLLVLVYICIGQKLQHFQLSNVTMTCYFTNYYIKLLLVFVCICIGQKFHYFQLSNVTTTNYFTNDYIKLLLVFIWTNFDIIFDLLIIIHHIISL